MLILGGFRGGGQFWRVTDISYIALGKIET